MVEGRPCGRILPSESILGWSSLSVKWSQDGQLARPKIQKYRICWLSYFRGGRAPASIRLSWQSIFVDLRLPPRRYSAGARCSSGVARQLGRGAQCVISRWLGNLSAPNRNVLLLIGGSVALLNAATLALLWLRRRSVLDLWLIVRCCAWLPDRIKPGTPTRASACSLGSDCRADARSDNRRPPSSGYRIVYYPCPGSSGKPSSFKNALCFSVADRICFSISTNSPCVAVRSISASCSAVLM
jgi:hypothetical protein